MSTQSDQHQYVELYFDLEKVNTKLSELHSGVIDALSDMTHVYLDENKIMQEGKKPSARAPLDIATRASLSSTLSMLIPQIEQLQYAVAFGQKACKVMSPSLQTSSTPN